MKTNNYSEFGKELDFNDDPRHLEQEAQVETYPRQRCDDSTLYCSSLEDVNEALRDAGYIKHLI